MGIMGIRPRLIAPSPSTSTLPRLSLQAEFTPGLRVMIASIPAGMDNDRTFRGRNRYHGAMARLHESGSASGSIAGSESCKK